MICPRCQDDYRKIFQTQNYDNSISRSCICQNCNIIYYTEERIKFVRVYDETQKQNVKIAYSKYQADYFRYNQ